MVNPKGDGKQDPIRQPLMGGDGAGEDGVEERANGDKGRAGDGLAAMAGISVRLGSAAPNVRRASRFVEDAFFGVSRVHPLETPQGQRWYHVASKVRDPMVLVLWCYVLLTFFERPQWCIHSAKLRSLDMCTDELYPTFNAPFLNRWADLAIELVFLALLCGQLVVQYLAFGRGTFAGLLNKMFVGLMVLAVADVIYAYTTPYSWTRLAPFIRVLLLTVRHKEIHGQFEVMWRILPAFGSISVLFAVFLLLFAWCGCILFTGDTDEGDMDIEENLYFSSLLEGMWTLIVLTTTNNSPNMIMPAYTANRLAILYYMLFLLLAYFFGLNMITAIIYKEYNNSRENNSAKRLAQREESLRQAFALLDEGSGSLSAEKMMEMFKELNRATEIDYIAEDRARLLFAAVDADGNKAVTEEEFMSVCDVLQVRFVEMKMAVPLEVRFPVMFKKRWFRSFCSFINGKLFEYIIDGLLLMNAVLFAMESAQTVGWNTENMTYLSVMSDIMETCFSLLFVLEVVAKVYVNGWATYWRKFSNKFDFVVTVATVVASLYVYLPGAYSNAKLIRWLQACRILRVVRFLVRWRSFRVIGTTFVKMLGPATRLLKVLFVIIFLFSALGVEIFGGKINRDPNSPYRAELENKAHGFAHPAKEYDFVAVNFNDMLSGMVTLFMFLVVNNWDTLVSGFVAVTSPWFRIFFVAFHFLGVLLCLNVATSFIIDIAIEFYSVDDKRKVIFDGGEAIVGNEIIIEADSITGTETGLKGRYRAIMPDSQIAQDANELMNRIFHPSKNKSEASSSAREQTQPTLQQVQSTLQRIGSTANRLKLPSVYEQDDRP